MAALQAHNTASPENRAAGFVDVGHELRLRLWPLRNVWTRRFARPGCKHLVDARATPTLLVAKTDRFALLRCTLRRLGDVLG